MIFTDTLFWAFILILILLVKIMPQKSYPYLICAFSIFFYGSLNFQFLIPLFVCLSIDYSVCLILSKSEGKTRKALMLVGIGTNLLILFYYKYYFNIMSELFNLTNIKVHLDKPLFPVGISFYVFQSISYILDVYKKNTKAEKNFFIYVLYVTFFPQLVIGPIEKGRHLIPQFKNLGFIGLKNCEEAIHLILYGLFKKVYVGNNLTFIIQNGLTNKNLDIIGLFLFSVLTTFKVYADFSGYSDIARGVAKIFNIELTINFRPFFKSKNPSDFWSSWHLSLTSWVKEYLFTALLGKSPSATRFYTALFCSFLIIGVWHGSTINWLLFGLFHAIVVIGYRMIKRNPIFMRIPDFFGYGFMFLFYAVCGFLHNNSDLKSVPLEAIINQSINTIYILKCIFLALVFIGPLIFFDRLQLNRNNTFFLNKSSSIHRYIIYMTWFVIILVFNQSNEGFIYYQF